MYSHLSVAFEFVLGSFHTRNCFLMIGVQEESTFWEDMAAGAPVEVLAPSLPLALPGEGGHSYACSDCDGLNCHSPTLHPSVSA